MKFPHFSSLEGASSKAQLVWSRVMFSRLTIIYFAFSFIHFAIQLGLQIRAFTINAGAASFLGDLVTRGEATTEWLPILRNENISVCNWVSSNLDTDVETCRLVWAARTEGEDVTEKQNTQAGGFPLDLPNLPSSTSDSVISSAAASSSASASTPASSPSSIVTTSTTVRPLTTTVFISAASPTSLSDDDDDEKDDDAEEYEEDDRRRRRELETTRVEKDGKVGVLVSGIEGQEPFTLDDTCLAALNWPLSIIRNTKREDIVFIAFQFWVLGMSMVALLNESIPHVLASLLTHAMSTAWAAFQITHTANFRSSFSRVIANGACAGTPPILPRFWDARAMAEYPSLAMHILSLLISAFLTWKLVKLYGWQTFKRVGASLTINRIYKIVLTLSITIQLSLFFMVVTVSLWIDQLMNSAIGDLASFTVLYKVSSFITLAVLVPWLCLGWVSVRRELRLPMFGFLVISVVYLAGWGVMFFSTTFRWTFVTWRFFSVMASASVALTCVAFILGVICRFNFDKGLLRYLGPHHDDSIRDDGSSMYSEKKDLESFAFPPANTLVPTFASTYSPDELPYRYDQKPGAARGPRFFNQDAAPFEEPGYQFRLSPPPAALTRNLTDVSPMKRSDSNGSDRTVSTYRSGSTGSRHDHSRDPSHASHSSQTKRWVIE
ncbi:hypothetical protein FA13DRAFT_1725010 [Coprinellus micaceus]|uniref:PalH-domain-containing protein n=1 Tax=Coprinellus micaceus TaxID=71717 RepID=A0A4Y7TXZ7_COPMI|nr:hypothetical protein FA13DRAFT_1725010 [Coprinellus micaceus]